MPGQSALGLALQRQVPYHHRYLFRAQMHEYVQMSAPANAVYIAYWILCVGYGAFVLAASVFSPPYRQRVHRGSWLHVAEGWVLVAVLAAACAWASFIRKEDAAAWSGHPPTPHQVTVATVAFWVLLPLAFTSDFV